jgi:hypothetical protein
MVKRVPPSFMSGSASRAMRMKEWQDTSIARRKPSREQSTTRPCRSLFGAKAMECTTKSRRPHFSLMVSNTASMAPVATTSSGRKIGASSSRASGST